VRDGVALAELYYLGGLGLGAEHVATAKAVGQGPWRDARLSV